MYITDKDELKKLYVTAKDEAKEWKRDYGEYERLANNDLIDDLDESLPEVNDGSLAAALFKLPKRVVSTDLTGRPKPVDSDDAWLGEVAKMQWENEIVPNANSQAPFHRKWKDAVRKAGIYGGIPLISLFTDRGGYTGADFIVGSPYDVSLEPGKVSDYDSDIMFWDIYLTDMQLDDMIEQAETETKESKESKEDGYNKWDVKALKAIKKAGQKDDKPSDEIEDELEDKSVDKTGHHFYIALQRGVESPFYMCHIQTGDQVREWSNPDPTGNMPIHYLYCYQDFVNPYGIGIVKLAGGTQNVLDFMRQSDVLATQIGLRPPKLIAGDMDDVDEDSLVYAEDANWMVGNASVTRQEVGNSIYSQLPGRMSMYKISLNQLIPTGDTSISSGSGDQDYSKTPAGVKFQQASLSIDDEDFKDNLYITYAAVAKSMINIHFANMQGSDLMKLSDEERELLTKAGIEFPESETGEPTNELEVVWDNMRASFDFEVDPEVDKDAEDKEKLDALLRVAELRTADPTLEQALVQSGKRLNVGELFSAIIDLTTENDKILEELQPEEATGGLDEFGSPIDPSQVDGQPVEEGTQDFNGDGVVDEADIEAAGQLIQGVMEQYGVSQEVAAAALEAERQGTPIDEIIPQLQEIGVQNG